MKKPKPSDNSADAGIRLGKNIAKGRHSKSWTQHDLAEMVGIDSVTLSRIETGASMPSIATLVKIGNALEVSLAELLGGISTNVSDQVREFADCIKPLAPSDRQMLLVLVRQLASRLSKK